MRQHLAEGVVGEGFGAAVRMMDAQHFAVGFAFQRGGLAQRVGDGDQVLALVEAVGGVFTRAILEAFDLGQGVPPQVFGLVGRVDDGVRQAVVAVEVFGFIAQGVDFGDQVALGVIAGLPGAAVEEGRFGDQGSAEVVLVFDLATQRVGFFKQTRKVIVLEPQPVAIRQLETGHVAGFVEVDGVLLTAEVATGNHAAIVVVVDLQLAPQRVSGPRGAVLEVVAVVKVFAIAGPVLHHTQLAFKGFPAVMTAQAQGVAVAGHHTIGVAETAHRIAVAIDHLDELAVVVIAVLHQGFNRHVVDDALDVGQAPQRVVIVQVHANTASGADVGQPAFCRTGEMQVMPKGIFQALQRNIAVVVRHLAEVEEQVVEGLQQVVAAFGADQVELLIGVIDAIAGLHIHKGHAAPLVIREVDEAAASAQALLPRQYPAFAEHAVDSQIAGIEARPFNRHEPRQRKVGFSRLEQQLAPAGKVDGIAAQTADCALNGRTDDKATGQIAARHGRAEFQCARSGRLQTLCHTQPEDRTYCAAHRGDDHQHVDGDPQPAGNFFVDIEIALSPAANEHIVRAAGDLRAAGEFVTLARSRHIVDENVGGAFGNHYRCWVFIANTHAQFCVGGITAVDEHIRGAAFELDPTCGRTHCRPYAFANHGDETGSQPYGNPQQNAAEPRRADRECGSRRNCKPDHCAGEKPAERTGVFNFIAPTRSFEHGLLLFGAVGGHRIGLTRFETCQQLQPILVLCGAEISLAGRGKHQDATGFDFERCLPLVHRSTIVHVVGIHLDAGERLLPGQRCRLLAEQGIAAQFGGNEFYLALDVSLQILCRQHVVARQCDVQRRRNAVAEHKHVHRAVLKTFRQSDGSFLKLIVHWACVP
ncbi:hypothetical protein D3C81_337060 [compost metagenome]